MPARRPPRAKTARPLTRNTTAPDRDSDHALADGTLDFTVVGVGASAGRLEARRHPIAALPAGHGMAFILVQHLDPTHDSMMVDLLAGNTTMTVRQVIHAAKVRCRLERLQRASGIPALATVCTNIGQPRRDKTDTVRCAALQRNVEVGQ